MVYRHVGGGGDYLTLRTYSRRMWIEEVFGDLEDGGFRLNRSRLYQPNQRKSDSYRP